MSMPLIQDGCVSYLPCTMAAYTEAEGQVCFKYYLFLLCFVVLLTGKNTDTYILYIMKNTVLDKHLLIGLQTKVIINVISNNAYSYGEQRTLRLSGNCIKQTNEKIQYCRNIKFTLCSFKILNT